MKALFIHVPKTGGTSLTADLRNALGPEKVVTGFWGYDVMHQHIEKNPDALIFSGHFHYDPSLRRHFDLIVTMLRHPVRRVFSLYRHALENDSHLLHELSLQGLTPFIEDKNPQVSDFMTRQFSSCRTVHVGPFDYVQALAMLSTFDCVACDDDIQGNIDSLFRGLLLEVQHNPSHERKSTGSFDPATLDQLRIIEARNPYDMALWKTVRSLGRPR